MTKKDYELIADELRTQHEMLGYNSGHIQGNMNGLPTATVYEMSCKLWAQTLANIDPRFNKNKFLTACGIES